MKKTLILIIVLCLIAAGAAGFFIGRNADGREPEAAPEETNAAPEETQAPAEIRSFDAQSLYESHDPKELVASVNGNDILWEEYFYNIYSQCMQVESYFNSVAQYSGTVMDWEDPASESGKINYADAAVESAETALRQFAAITGFAEENDVVLGPDVQKAMEEEYNNSIKSFCGEDADEDDFREYLEKIYMTPEMFEKMNEINFYFQQNYIQLYGERGEKFSDEQTMKYLTDRGYIHANHILLSTVDPATGADLDETALKEKEEKANEIYAELSAIEDEKELLKRFDELKKEFCEDSGKANFMDGMTFTPGTMVKEFEDACLALEEYKLSEPVKSQFGYHIILRLPLDPDAVVGYSQLGTPITARGDAANVELNTRLQDYMNTLSIEYKEGFEKPNILDYVK